MTNEERYRMLVAQSQGMQPGMMNQGIPINYDLVNQDLTGQRNRLQLQNQYARQMMDSSGESPELIRAGNVSVAGANPLTALAQALRGGAGAYLSYKTGKDQKALETQQGKIDAEKGRLAKSVRAREEMVSDRDYNLKVREQEMAEDELEAKKQGKGYFAKTLGSGGSGGFAPKRVPDQYGNDTFMIPDPTSPNGVRHVFADGETWTEERASKMREESKETTSMESFAKVDAKNIADAIPVARASIDNYAQTMLEYDVILKALEDGANTGPISDFFLNLQDPTLRLYGAQDRLAMEKIGQHTFGSLSEAEAAWLRRVSVNTKLGEETLKEDIELRREVVRRAIEAERYSMEMFSKGRRPDQEEIDRIKYEGFDWGGFRKKESARFASDEDLPTATPDQAEAAVAQNAPPKVGDVQDGFRFKGGDPADPKNWEEE